jgi:hypothetical protein
MRQAAARMRARARSGARAMSKARLVKTNMAFSRACVASPSAVLNMSTRPSRLIQCG